MNRDVKVGLAVIAVLLVVFGAALFMRLRDQEKQLGDGKAKAGAKHEKDNKKDPDSKNVNDEKPRRRLASGPTLSGSTAPWREPSSRYDRRTSDAASERLSERANGDRWQSDNRSRRNDDRNDPNDTNDGNVSESTDDTAAPIGSAVANPFARAGLGNDRAPTDASSALTFNQDATDRDEPVDEAPASEGDAVADDQAPRDAVAADSETNDEAASDDGFRRRRAMMELPAEGTPTADESADVSDRGGAMAAEEEGFHRHDRDAVDARADVDRGNRFTDSYDRPSRDALTRPGLQPADDDVRLRPSPASDRITDDVPMEADRYSFAGGTYTVEANDNFWTISKKVYGTVAYFKALEEHNREQYPDGNLLNVGDVVQVPDASVLQQTYPKLCPKPGRPSELRSAAQFASQTRSPHGRTYQVNEGDTLFGIAKQELGRAARWKEIYDLNRDQLGNDVNYLAPGMLLQLPDDAPEPRDPVTRRPRRGNYRR